MTSEAIRRTFSALDNAPSDAQRVALEYLDSVAGHPEIQRVRSHAMELFSPAPGERLLEAGCGLGEIARQLGRRVGSQGAVVAVDRSEQAIAVARSRGDDGPVSYAVGDMTALDFPDGHFDGVRSERVMQHLADPQSAVRELARVTRPGGRVCVIDTDWLSATAPALHRLGELIATFDHRIPDSGSRMYSYLVGAGLREVTALPVTLRFTSQEDAGAVVPLFDRRIISMFAPAELIDAFIASAAEATARGHFLFAFTMWITIGRVSAAA